MRLRAALAVVFVLTAVAAGCGGDGASDEASDRPTPTPEPATPTILNPRPAEAPLEAPEGAAFYIPPDPLPAGEPGEIIWAAEVQAPAGAKAWKVLYRSRAVDGSDIAVSGFVIAPDEPFGEALRAVVTWAHGTSGLADHCAPSLADDLGPIVPFTNEFIAAGYVVVATDYEGLGTPGVHPYLVGESEGRSVLDAARAAAHLPTGAGGPVFIYGHSQGGHSALFAGEVAAGYAPELTIGGVISAAPVVELKSFGDFLKTTDLYGLAIMASAGFDVVYDPDLTAGALTSAGQLIFPIVETGCVFDIIAAFGTHDSAVTMLPEDNPEIVARAEANSPGNEPTGAPVLVFHGTEDNIIPAGLAVTWAEKACALGTNVDLRIIVGGDHSAPVFGPGVPEATLAWIADRLTGVEAASNCDSLPYPGQPEG